MFSRFGRTEGRFALCQIFREHSLCSTVAQQGLFSSSGSSWAWEASSRLICQGEESREEELGREGYKYCMAATLLLPEPSYCCYSALCKNVTSLHCSALNRVEITNCTLGLESPWHFLEMGFIREVAGVTVLSAFPPCLKHLSPLSGGSGIYCSTSVKVFRGSEIPEGVTFLWKC